MSWIARFFLPRIAPESITEVDPSTTTIVENPTLGVMLEIPPNTAKNPDGTNFTGDMSISEVPDALAPAALPENLQSYARKLVTVISGGVFG